MTKKNIEIRGAPDFMKFYKSLATDDKLKEYIDDAIGVLKSNHLAGDQIKNELWPKKYVHEHGITNLFRYKLPDAYRMIYTFSGEDRGIICILIEVMSHKEYEKRFGY